MPEGPFGFPRLTDIGPFVEKDATQEFKRKESEYPSGSGIADTAIAIDHNIRKEEITKVDAEIVVREEVESKEGILGDITESIERATAETSVAWVTYWFAPGKAGKIISVKVNEPFRERGVATQLKEGEMDYMREQGVEWLYTDVVSEPGYRLAKKTGFEPIDNLMEDRQVTRELIFSYGANRGAMYRTL